MSRIGRLPVPVPAGVDVSIVGNTVTVKGPKGTLTHAVVDPITVAKETASSRSRVPTTTGSPGPATGSPARC